MRKWITKTLSALTAGLCMLSAVSLPSVIPSAQVYAADFMESNTVDGYYYELWNQNYAGDFDYENTENNGFTFSWDRIEDAFALKGELFERRSVYASQLKEYTVTYDEDIDYNDQNAFSGIYGWMEDDNSTYEYYIVDSWGSWRPNTDDFLGSYESNGMTYDIYKGIRYQMSCFGNNPTTYIYYSVARENLAEKIDGVCNIKNTINLADHLKAWQDAGLKLGLMYDAGFSVQCYRSSGSAKVNSIEINKNITETNNFGPQFAHTRHEPLPTDEEGRKEYIDFETENEKVRAPFTKTEASYDTDHYFGGQRSLLVSGEKNAERAFEYNIDPYDFSSKELLAGMKLYHNGGKNVRFTFQIANNGENGSFRKDLYSRTIPSGIWTDIDDLRFLLSNNLFANEVIRIIPSEPVDFFVDDLYIGDACDIKDKLAKKEHAVIGDINRDNKVDIYDVVAVRRLLLNTEDYNVNFYQDVNGDCKLNISDLVALTKFVLGKTKQIPEPEKERVYFADDFSEIIGGAEFNAVSRDDTAGEIKSAVCSDGTFSTQWNDKNYYELSSFQNVENLDELSLKYSGTVKADSCSEYVTKGSVKTTIDAEFRNGSDSVRFIIEDGADEDERLRWLSGPDEMKLVEIGGKEYYIDKNEDLPEEIETDRFIWLYPKENAVKTDEVCNFDSEIDFSEILKYFGKEEYKPYSLECSVVTYNTNGFAEFKEISCTDKSKSE
ncbi:glycoside hydrolase family 11 protein [Ruminococcus sp.]|uniref:glycoside hydrolase family 11 protein n=1 Tax=Ruminococcus sp. TaxID=41978 RepID=UPI0025DA46A2|nr:glycoside hydrolase family 11 protein [Ruminococcus sp.]MCR4638573.1 glycoside hydrolase family 11 protein [Ruminococcus sp.]